MGRRRIAITGMLESIISRLARVARRRWLAPGLAALGAAMVAGTGIYFLLLSDHSDFRSPSSDRHASGMAPQDPLPGPPPIGTGPAPMNEGSRSVARSLRAVRDRPAGLTNPRSHDAAGDPELPSSSAGAALVLPAASVLLVGAALTGRSRSRPA